MSTSPIASPGYPMPKVSYPNRNSEAGTGTTGAQTATEAEATTDKAKSSKPGHEESVKAAINKVESFIGQNWTDLHFQIDPSSQNLVVKVVDLQTKETIRQIPSEEFLQLSRVLDKMKGLFLKTEA